MDSKSESNTHKKIGRIALIAGIVLLVLSITFIIIGIIKSQGANAEYEKAYAEWYHKWWDLHTAGLQEQPKKPMLSGFIVIGSFLGVFSIFLIGAGAISTFSKNASYGMMDRLVDQYCEMNEKVEERMTYTCDYCGYKYDKSLEKCPNCGAITGKKKK